MPHSVRLEPKVNGGDNQSYQGIGWYRRHFPLDNSYAGKKLFVEFEAAMTTTEVWVNGTYLGIHHGGYTPFTVDITNYVHLDGTPNVIAVKLDNRDDPQTPPGKPQKIWILPTSAAFIETLNFTLWITCTLPMRYSRTKLRTVAFCHVPVSQR